MKRGRPRRGGYDVNREPGPGEEQGRGAGEEEDEGEGEYDILACL